MNDKYPGLVIFVVEFILKIRPNKGFMPVVPIVKATSALLWIAPRDFNAKPF